MTSKDKPQTRQADSELEVYGEVEIERHVKDDGRALILYTHPQARGRTRRSRNGTTEHGEGPIG